MKESLFAHEKGAIQEIERQVKAHDLGYVLANMEIHDVQSNKYFESDLTVITQFGIYVVELKHWSGLVEIKPNSWLQNKSFHKKDPHKVNDFKAKLLRGLYERKFAHLPSLYFESVVVLTNPEASVEGASSPKTTAHNPTCDGIDRFIEYLRNQRKIKKSIIKNEQCKAFAGYLRKLVSPGRPRDFVFPGYEVVERLYQGEERAEIVARRTDVRHRRLSRLRIFMPPLNGSEGDQTLFFEKANATLNAVTKTGDHPNILKVWSIPNDNNYIIEGSDWSETGTLRDLLSDEKQLSVTQAISIILGILAGLEVVHSEMVVHRMLSPENILMVDDTPKLMNFDLSYQLEDGRTTVIPDVAKLRRTAYIAPEIYRGGSTPEAMADLFSVGVMFFEMLTGEKPFKSSTDLERSGGHLSQTQEQALDRCNVSAKLKSVIIGLVCFDAAERPATATQVFAQLSAEIELPPTKVATNVKLNAGSQSGLYEIEEFLFSGAQAQIYRAHGARGKQVIIKLFNADVPLQKVVDEHQFAGTLHHPSIVRVDSYSRWDDDRLFISFDWVSSRSLRDEIESGSRPSLERFHQIANDLIDVVDVLHRWQEDEKINPILHNDIKPDNILLTDGDRPVLVDFGSASHPWTALYEGTEGYVAPDLQLGEDRRYSEDGDLYALGVTLYEWLHGNRPTIKGINEQDLIGKGSPSSLVRWFVQATAPEANGRFASATEMRDALKSAIEEILEGPEEGVIQEPDVVPVGQVSDEEPTDVINVIKGGDGTCGDYEQYGNPFVTYLNTLQSRNAANENALAESQVRNPYFSVLHVSHPISEKICDVLQGEQYSHVILTGHAGDGKTTIGVEVLKKLQGLSMAESIEREISPREDVQLGGNLKISLIKDLSEGSEADRISIIDEIAENNGSRFLLVSNTGALLNSFKLREKRVKGDVVTIENGLLEAIDSQHPRVWNYRDANLVIINLSLMDNLTLARQIFEKMITEERWASCESLSCRDNCPILNNVRLIQGNKKIIFERLLLAYRRMYEYETRLTLRQLSEHLSYIITSGLTCSDILLFNQKVTQPHISQHLFFNRFFGDNGCEDDDQAQQLYAVEAVRSQDFGSRFTPTLERKLWLKDEGQGFIFSAEGGENTFNYLKSLGAKTSTYEGISAVVARRQVRRMLFFMHSFNDDNDRVFLNTFLNSFMILDFAKWQRESDAKLKNIERMELHRRILHVLQEHFTGIKRPEGDVKDNHLFITLSRRTPNVRQSTQVVLARIQRDDIALRLDTEKASVGGIRSKLVAEYKQGKGDEIFLELGLPFLDYMMMRDRGEVGGNLQASYVDRLERFKEQIRLKAEEDHSDHLRLVNMRTNNTLRQQIYIINDGKLEVSDG